MQMRASVERIGTLDGVVERMLRAARVPGAAIAIVRDGRMMFSKGYGYRDVARKLALTPATVYPIASTTKAINATILGMLVQEGKVAWDAPVRQYLPNFRLQHVASSDSITVRDLVVMRTGLPRHDFVWNGDLASREDLVTRLAHLPASADFRERFQYNNLTTTLAGHVAEIASGQRWEDLVRRRILEPLGMNATGFEMPSEGEVTLSYHENRRRELLSIERLETMTISPAGGSIHSTVNDMSRWIAFNLNGGSVDGRQLIDREILNHMQSSCVAVGAETTSPSLHATYGLGWYVDTYNGRPRVTHSGNLHGVNSNVMLFPSDGIGLVCFVNFSTYRFAQLVNEHAFDSIMGFEPVKAVEDVLARYERNIEDSRVRNSSVRRVENTSPSHPLDDYTGTYVHPGYGRIEIHRNGRVLQFKRHTLTLPMDHWHYDAWVIAESDMFDINSWHPWERANRIVFETNADGAIAAFTMQVEPAVPPARFEKRKPA